jgi:ribose/xylose/arabinose/galactoside ABC-type transport system permease subunit
MNANSAASEHALKPQRGRLERVRAGLMGLAARLRPQEVGLLLAIVILACFFGWRSPLFLSLRNIGNILEQSTFLSILAIGTTFVVISGQFDLSIGSMYGLSAIIFALLLQSGTDLPLAVATAIVVGALFGLLNGVLTVILSVPAIIITLGTVSVYRGIAWWLSNGFPVSNFTQDAAFFKFGQRHLIPWPPGLQWMPDLVLVPLVFGILGHLLLSRTAFGHHLYAIGSNSRAASVAGVQVGRTQVIALVISGISAALSGLMGVAQSGAADPNGGVGFELDVIAGVIIGGAAIQGGRGNVAASILGVLLIGEVRNGLIIMGVNLYGQVIVSGILIILAVAVDRYISRRARGGRGLLQDARRMVRVVRGQLRQTVKQGDTR